MRGWWVRGVGLVALVAVVSLGVTAFFASQRPWWEGWTIGDSCEHAGLFRSPSGDVRILGKCSGVIPFLPPGLSISVGDTIDIKINTSTDSRNPHPWFSVPTSANPDIIKLESATADGSLATYLAVGPGNTDLTASGICETTEGVRPGTCTVLQIGVVDR